MRVLLIGFPLPNPSFDNYDFLQAPSFYDYDAVLIEPAQVSKVIEDVLTRSEDHQTYAGEPVLNEPAGPFVVGLADHLQRRREETERLLAAGKLLIVLVRPNVPHSHVLGLPGYDRYSWLPAPSNVVYRPPQLMPADGRGVTLEDATHPFAPLVDRFQNWFTYRAAFSERMPDFPSYGRVLMRSPGGVPIGVELKVGPGRILFLPALDAVPSGDMRFELANTLHAAIKRTLAGEGDEDAPAWAGDYSVPGLEEAEAEIARAELAAREAQDRLTEVQARSTDLGRFRRLLWMTSSAGLDPAVRAAFREIGFMVEYDEARPISMQRDDHAAFVEVEGAEEQVVEWPYLRLQRRLEKDMLANAKAKKGVIVINGYARRNPARRPEQASPALRVACENYRYALITGAQLFDMVRSAREDPSDDNLRALRATIMTAEGALAGAQVVDETSEPDPAEPAQPASPSSAGAE
ncbi:MAG: hypothetical protein ACRDJE_23955 [Dehalococcoidia bacterium]